MPNKTEDEFNAQQAQLWRVRVESEDGYYQLKDYSVQITPEWHEYSHLAEKALRRLRWICADLLATRAELAEARKEIASMQGAINQAYQVFDEYIVEFAAERAVDILEMHITVERT